MSVTFVLVSDWYSNVADVSEQAVKMRLHRARGVLRQVLYDRVGSAALPPFSFDGERCDRIVAGVLVRLSVDVGA